MHRSRLSTLKASRTMPLRRDLRQSSPTRPGDRTCHQLSHMQSRIKGSGCRIKTCFLPLLILNGSTTSTSQVKIKDQMLLLLCHLRKGINNFLAKLKARTLFRNSNSKDSGIRIYIRTFLLLSSSSLPVCNNISQLQAKIQD